MQKPSLQNKQTKQKKTSAGSVSAVRDLRNNMHFSHLQNKECFIGIFKNQNEQGNSKDYIKKSTIPEEVWDLLLHC